MQKKLYAEKQLVYLIHKYQNVIIYGAGMVGELTGKRLLSQGLTEKLIGFAVSKKGKSVSNEDKLCGLPIYEIVELEKYREGSLVIVATLPNIHCEIEKTLLDLRFKNIVFMTDRLYHDLCKLYMLEYNKKHPAVFSTGSRTRVLLMASDNNKTSGAFLCMAELCGQMIKRGVSVFAVLPQYGTGEELLIKKKIPYTFIPSKDWGFEIVKEHNYLEKLRFLVSILSNRKAKGKLVNLIQSQEISLVHCNTSYTYIGALAAKQCGLPYVWHIREHMEELGYRMFFPSKALKLIQGADQIITVSEYIRNVMGLAEAGQTKVIYDAVDDKGILKRHKKLFEDEIVRMIVVGVLVPYKKQKELIESCNILKERNIENFRLQIVGKGTKSYTDELKELVNKYHLEEQVEFYGLSSNVFELYNQADVAFTCCATEAYGRVTIEALLSGCLVIGVNAGATPELIVDGETGYLYEAGSVQALAEKIIYAINNPMLSRKIADNGQEYAKKTYTKEKNLQQIIEVYEDALKRKL